MCQQMLGLDLTGFAKRCLKWLHQPVLGLTPPSVIEIRMTYCSTVTNMPNTHLKSYRTNDWMGDSGLFCVCVLCLEYPADITLIEKDGGINRLPELN